MQKYEIHEIALVFPQLVGKELDDLTNDVKARGLLEPVWLFEGKILDGRNRAIACEDAGVELTTRNFSGTPQEALAFAWSANRFRRHLSSSQVAICEIKREKLDAKYAEVISEMKAAAKKTQIEAGAIHGKKGGRGKKKQDSFEVVVEQEPIYQCRVCDELFTQSDLFHCKKCNHHYIAGNGECHNCHADAKKKPDMVLLPPIPSHTIEPEKENRQNQTAQVRAKKAGTNRAYLEVVEKLLETNPEKLVPVEKGEKTLSQVIKEIKKEEAKAKLESIEVKEAKAVEGVYDVLVIDPPWPMEKIDRDCRPNQVEMDYPTMTEKELQELHIPATDDCHVWVWTTHRFLPMALRLLNSWGLQYVCTFVWHKPGGFQVAGFPQYNCEFAIYARKGSPKFVDTKAFSTCFNAPRGSHSEKPGEFYDTVTRVTAGRRLDMFSRRTIEGFDAWGKEAVE